jgi:hypothetical protein
MMGIAAEKIKISKKLIRPVGTYGAESWTLNKDIAKRLVTFERLVLRRMCRGITANGDWRKRYNKGLMQLFGDLDILSFIGICRLNWNDHVNRMDSKRNISQIFNNNPQGSRLSESPKNRWRDYVQTDINICKITNWTERSKTEMAGRSPLRRRRTELDCSAI